MTAPSLPTAQLALSLHATPRAARTKNYIGVFARRWQIPFGFVNRALLLGLLGVFQNQVVSDDSQFNIFLRLRARPKLVPSRPRPRSEEGEHIGD